MKNASDFRTAARAALAGNWGMALVASVIVSLLGGGSAGPSFNFEFSLPSSDTEIVKEYAMREEILAAFLAVGVLLILLIPLFLVIAAAGFVLGSIIEVGDARFNLYLIDERQTDLAHIFAYFRYWGKVTLASLLRNVYIFLWSLLFIIPGIIASYSYAMVPYLMAETPTLTAGEAVARSKEMMNGNRFSLFCLELSFIGWDLLCILTFGIGYLWLTPYKKAARADFYREISGTRPVIETVAQPAPSEN